VQAVLTGRLFYALSDTIARQSGNFPTLQGSCNSFGMAAKFSQDVACETSPLLYQDREFSLMRIVVAPDKFKGCLSAAGVADAMERGLRRAAPEAEIDRCPMADGGEGTVEALVGATGGLFVVRRVTGPLPEMKVDARFGILGDGGTAVIEMSAASGLALLRREDLDPTRTTTFGTGELLMAAAQMGVSRIVLGIGGSATIDGGVGCAQACGLPVILEGGETVSAGEPLVGADVHRVVLIKNGRGSIIERVRIEVACDVTNPLCGQDGAAMVYGPQKGATPAQIRELDAALMQLARRTGKLDQANLPGAGAAGGLGFGMAAFFGAALKSGVEIVMDAVRLRDRLKSADLCVTGEGRFDSQSLRGKAVGGVAGMCKQLGVPCVVLAGSVDQKVDFSGLGIIGAYGVNGKSVELEESIKNAAELISTASENILIQLKRN
jgi:glycerate 2-kinase